MLGAIVDEGSDRDARRHGGVALQTRWSSEGVVGKASVLEPGRPNVSRALLPCVQTVRQKQRFDLSLNRLRARVDVERYLKGALSNGVARSTARRRCLLRRRAMEAPRRCPERYGRRQKRQCDRSGHNQSAHDACRLFSHGHGSPGGSNGLGDAARTFSVRRPRGRLAARAHTSLLGHAHIRVTAELYLCV